MQEKNSLIYKICHNLNILIKKWKVWLNFTFFQNDYKCTVANAYLIKAVNEIVYDTLGLITAEITLLLFLQTLCGNIGSTT